MSNTVKVVNFNKPALVSDNSTINRLGFKRYASNDEENESIASKCAPNQILPITENFQTYLEANSEIDINLRPSLRSGLVGPFLLSSYNQGAELHKSMIIFDVKREGHKENTGDIIHPDDVEWLSKSLAMLPFFDLFGAQILKEAERAEKLIKSSTVRDLSQERNKKEIGLVEDIMHAFYWTLSNENSSSEDVTKTIENRYGKEAMIDNLASSLIADISFYNLMWDQISRFFEPAIRDIGEQYALGNISFDNPSPITI